jgi:hypothetical protein
MKVVAFAGPSVPAAERRRFAAVEWRPPAEAGDLLRIDAEPGTVVCLIDGYFDHRPAVRHKEILLLLSEGVQVRGASSMGALRAAEMDALGMIGTGAIYRAYARGTIMGDDEVALIHAGADRDWRALSVPLVDVRATLCRARRERLLDRQAAREVFEAAAAIHYVDRDWPALISACRPRPENERFLTWLPLGQVEQKKQDALLCMTAALCEGQPAIVRPTFVRTPFLDSLARERGIDLGARPKTGP